MFSYLKNFVHRHRRKFMFAGIAVGGVALLGKLAEHKLLEWHNEQSRQLLEQQKKKQHYERTLNTVRVALLQLTPKMRKVLEEELDTEALILAIKDQPQKKRELWDQLKIVGFGRAVCTVVTVAVVTPVSHVIMMVLAANTLGAADDTTMPEGCSVSVEVQTRYLSCLQSLIEDQLPELVGKVMKKTSNALSSLPLTRKLTLTQLEAILQEICLSVTNNSEDTASSTSVLPWSQYLRQPQDIISSPEDSEQFRRMFLLTLDILNTDDFNEVVNTLVQVGLNYVLDEMAGFYFSNHIAIQQEACEALKKEPSTLSKPVANDGAVLEKGWNDAVNNTRKGEDPSDDTHPISEKTVQEESGQSPLQTTTRDENIDGAYVDSETSGSSSSNAELVTSLVVKLVPMLNSILHKALPDVHHLSAHMLPSEDNNTLFGRLVLCSQLEAFSFNVYDSLVLNGAVADARG